MSVSVLIWISAKPVLRRHQSHQSQTSVLDIMVLVYALGELSVLGFYVVKGTYILAVSPSLSKDISPNIDISHYICT